MKIIRSNHVLIGVQNEPVEANVYFQNGKIERIVRGKVPEGNMFEVVDYGDLYVMPGLVDSHVHINDPGTDWEGFTTATRAACAGGITTIVDMPLNSLPVTTTMEALNAKKAAARSQPLAVNVALLGGIVPDNIHEIAPMVEQGGVVGFKSFMIHSGIDPFPAVNEAVIRKAMEQLRMLRMKGLDVVYMFHAEVECGCHGSSSPDPRKYHSFLSTRGADMELKAIEMVARLTLEYRVRTHIVHLSNADAAQVITRARAKGAEITAETTYTYLYFNAESIPDGDTRYKCCPPIRESTNCLSLWNALADGTVTQVISDHSPSPASLKHLDTGNFLAAWGGIASLGLGLPVVWTAAKKRGFLPSSLVQWMCRNTAQLVRLHGKGQILEGMDADFVVWDPSASFFVTKDMLHIRHADVCCYIGQELFGKVHHTYLGGNLVFSEGAFLHDADGSLLPIQ